MQSIHTLLRQRPRQPDRHLPITDPHIRIQVPHGDEIVGASRRPIPAAALKNPPRTSASTDALVARASTSASPDGPSFQPNWVNHLTAKRVSGVLSRRQGHARLVLRGTVAPRSEPGSLPEWWAGQASRFHARMTSNGVGPRYFELFHIQAAMSGSHRSGSDRAGRCSYRRVGLPLPECEMS